MLLIRALDKLLLKIDNHFGLKLKIDSSAQDRIAKIETALISFLKKEGGVGLEGPLIFNLTWSEFMNQDQKAFSDILQYHIKDLGLDVQKQLIMFRLRKNIEKARNSAKEQLLSRDKEKEAALEEKKEEKKEEKSENKVVNNLSKIKNVKKNSIDSECFDSVTGEIVLAKNMIDFFRKKATVSVTSNVSVGPDVGKTEPLLETMSLELEKYYHFYRNIDKKTNRAPGEIHALCDMLPSVALSTDPLIHCYLHVMDYIFENVTSDSEYEVGQKKPSKIGSLINIFRRSIEDPHDVSESKRANIESLLIELTKQYSLDSILKCVDVHFGDARNITPYLKKCIITQRIETCYKALHADLLELASDEVRHKHGSECRGFV